MTRNSDLRNGSRRAIKKSNYKLQKVLTIISFLIVPLTLLIVFTYVPLYEMFRYSFYRKNIASPRETFIKFDNYEKAFSREEYFALFKVSLYYMVGSFVQIVLALYFATIFAYKVAGKNIFKGILFFPSLLNGVAIGFMFLYFFKQGGALDSLLVALGLPEQKLPLWLGNASLVNISLTFVSVWRYMGQNMVLFDGAVQSISGDFFEAAELDGANRWQQFRYLIFPSIKPVVLLNLILAVKGSLAVFEIPLIMTNGLNKSSTFVMKMLSLAFQEKQFGLACCLGVILLMITLAITLIQKLFFEKDERKEQKAERS